MKKAASGDPPRIPSRARVLRRKGRLFSRNGRDEHLLIEFDDAVLDEFLAAEFCDPTDRPHVDNGTGRKPRKRNGNLTEEERKGYKLEEHARHLIRNARVLLERFDGDILNAFRWGKTKWVGDFEAFFARVDYDRHGEDGWRYGAGVCC